MTTCLPFFPTVKFYIVAKNSENQQETYKQIGFTQTYLMTIMQIQTIININLSLCNMYISASVV
jgi:hypothetical protein